MQTPSLGLATFTQLIGETFSVDLANGTTVDLRLTTVNPASEAGGPAQSGPPTRDRFALLFTGPDAAPIGQGTYPFSHTAIGTQAIFIVPVARDTDGLIYEAVFN